mmetsp:Transcript_27618/g.63296  ORF Transcript_27618/g.63296 Transcript_27618/m.63296 type:complete len:315 (-) Transcript_27618:102-1046(-)
MSSSSYTKIQDIESDGHDPSSFTKPTLQTRTRSRFGTCLRVTLILFGLVLAFTLATGIYGYVWTARTVKKWTVAEPDRDIPIIDLSREQVEVFKDRAKLFFDLLLTDEVPDDFVATEREIDGLLAASDYLRGGAYVHLDVDRVAVPLSLSVNCLPGGRGRYLVGSQSFEWSPEASVLHARMQSPLGDLFDMKFHLVRTNDGNLSLTFLEGRFLDMVAPQEFINENYNLLSDLYDCDDDRDEECQQVRNVLNGLNKISLKKDRMVFSAHGKSKKYKEYHGKDSTYGISHRFLAGSQKSLRKPGWKFHLVRRLMAY